MPSVLKRQRAITSFAWNRIYWVTGHSAHPMDVSSPDLGKAILLPLQVFLMP
ncbi:Uncharacterised protein [Legionella pneumophila]|uniref:Uncharacterized protein n=2 Tax=Legionella TaxID=445 RepID=A0A378KP57_9GAMM|nr:hypothetical protein ULM_35340 [Legionella pneumophila]KTC67584.1 hypothetical protein Lani_3152 [Legionella anisa]KTD15763.1 hypothetical protein Lgra_0016 [Legionella gratiana]KTD44954.1 hypothetical protein Lpar_0022 [Legionella parisiensis]OEH46470.1 hypothetical protein lpari_02538 [Legionella parisiensis]